MLTVQPCAHPHSGNDAMQTEVSEELAASMVRVVQNWTYFNVNCEDGKFLWIDGMKLRHCMMSKTTRLQSEHSPPPS